MSAGGLQWHGWRRDGNNSMGIGRISQILPCRGCAGGDLGFMGFLASLFPLFWPVPALIPFGNRDLAVGYRGCPSPHGSSHSGHGHSCQQETKGFKAIREALIDPNWSQYWSPIRAFISNSPRLSPSALWSSFLPFPSLPPGRGSSCDLRALLPLEFTFRAETFPCTWGVLVFIDSSLSAVIKSCCSPSLRV